MDEWMLHVLENMTGLLGELRASLVGQTEQYERDKLREATEALRSCKSALEPKVAALRVAKQRDGRL